MKEKVNIISLGCARNLVDTEVMAGLLQQDHYEMVSEPTEADIVLINTCSFIEAAKEEAIDTILETARLKEEGRLQTLVVAGCLPQRYFEQLTGELPEVDLFIGTGEVPRIAEILKEHREGKKQRTYVGIPRYLYDHVTPRLRTTPSYTAFLKVSEGCDHKCAFCIIPQLRGPHRSRPIDSIVKEATVLAEGGVKEINLIAQDLTAYGRERRDGATLYGLLKEMALVSGIHWIRLLYAYPNFLDEPLLRLIRENEKICKYVDIPFQHISARILTRMRRGKSGSAVREAVHRLRRAIPDITLRTSLIVGFPGETDEDFRELLDFVEEAQFDRLGVFKYSFEDGTAAALMEDQLPEEEKERRWQEVMELQAEISRRKNETLIGTVERVMIEGRDADTGRLFGRTQAHAPEVDGAVTIEKGLSDERQNNLRPGDMVDVRITQVLDYDLIGDILHG
ncbi:MAG: ribosomal protein S12 methylthiotransferase RimO [Deltaproteobacteria bacterium RIFOXYA2_FULL_55_11]|nr:MAG: ribosomal protein S12 methylthiotransferase RimO [Deltaproteobacteria bacterium RIFOXYA2_FULL_55_11]